jgi:signal transduction histidine kinase
VARDYPDRVPEGQLARDVLAEEQRMEELVTALLVLARVDDGAASAHQPVDLDDVVLEAVRRSRAQAARGPERTEGSVEPPVDPPTIDATGVSAGQVVGDPVLIGRVVDNLLSNAVRHARTGVVVSVTEDRTDATGRVLLTIDDDGNGIAPEERDRIFQRFVRLDESRARDDGGSGLGLAIVRRVVEAMAGTVDVSASPAGGARFVVSLPAA